MLAPVRARPARPAKSPKTAPSRRPPAYRVRRSSIHGRGVFAARAIEAGERVGEYRGRRITAEEMERRWQEKPGDESHTFFFQIDDDVVIDAGEGGNGVRYINHSCAPNCSTLVEDGRVYVEALRAIEPGEELGYDYLLTPGDPADALEHFACACGADSCRGTMVDPKALSPAIRRAARRRVQAARK